MKKQSTTVISIALAAGIIMAVGRAAWASSVTLPNTFSTGTTAQASQVNANFTAVKTAVDDNYNRIVTLQAKKGIVSKVFTHGTGSAPTVANTWQWLSPTVTVSISSGQQLEVIASVVLGCSSTSLIGYNICYQYAGGAITEFSGGWQQVNIAGGTQSSLTSFTLQTPAAGSFAVGLCGKTSMPFNFSVKDYSRIVTSIYG